MQTFELRALIPHPPVREIKNLMPTLSIYQLYQSTNFINLPTKKPYAKKLYITILDKKLYITIRTYKRTEIDRFSTMPRAPRPNKKLYITIHSEILPTKRKVTLYNSEFQALVGAADRN